MATLPASATLFDRAHTINRLLDAADRADKIARTAVKRRWEAGVELIAAQKLVPHGQWQAWCKANIKRSLNDIRKIMAMAGADDPDGAHAAEKEARRESMARTRSNRALPHEQSGSAVGQPTTPHPKPSLTVVPKGIDPTDQVVAQWIATTAGLSIEDKRRAFRRIQNLMIKEEINAA